MYQLDVRLDNRLFETLYATATASAGDAPSLRKRLEEVVLREGVFRSERHLIAQDLAAWFDLDAMASSSDFWHKQVALRSHIEEHLDQSVAALTPFLPLSTTDRSMSLVVHLLPGFAQCYGPAEGIQLFALRAEADPAEALLFLIHVYYHEISSLFYTETSRRAAENPDSVELFRHWILLLIQNEGLANYAVLKPLLEFQAQERPFFYFTYAGLIHNLEATTKAMILCRNILSQLENNNFQQLRGNIQAILKNPRLPVINLLGIHLAETIAAAFGENALFAVAEREPHEFFRLYGESGDPLCQYLFGREGEVAPVLGGLVPG